MDYIRRLARVGYEYFWLIFGYAYFGLCALVVSAASVPLYWLLPRRAGEWVAIQASAAVFRSFLRLLQASGLVKLDLSALDALRDEPGLIIAPNHPCLLDAVFVMSRVPRAGCIMKAELWDNIFLGRIARLAGHIRNDSPVRMVREASRELHSGRPLLVFPEGTRTRKKPVNTFKGGIALIAKQAGATVQTVFIETHSPFLSKGWPWFKKPDLPIAYRARLGARFRVQGDVRTFCSMLEAYYRGELADREPKPQVAVASPTAPPSHHAAA